MIEFVPQLPQNYESLELDTPHPENERLGLDLRLVWQGPSSADPNQMVRVYCGPRTNEDLYNYAISYSGESNAAPIYLRSYLERRDAYQPLPKGKPLKGVVNIRITNPGVGYSGAEIDIDVPGPVEGRQAKAIATVKDGKIQTIRIIDEGTLYETTPLVYINGENGQGSGATARAFIQPIDAVLVKEETKKLTEEIPEMFRGWTEEMLGGVYVRVTRIYETLPGPWVYSSRWDEKLGPVEVKTRSVLTGEPPQVATSDASFETTYEAREGSTVVSLEKTETHGTDPYDRSYTTEVDEILPEVFRADFPIEIASDTEPGRPKVPILDDTQGELSRTSTEEGKFWTRETVKKRNLGEFPKINDDLELGGISAKGSDFKGIVRERMTVDRADLVIEKGFGILASQVKNLGRGLNQRTTRRMAELQGASLLLTNPGESYEDPPIVDFSDGDVGSGAAADVVLSPIAGAGPVDVSLTLGHEGDDRGVFCFLGKRAGGGTWTNPFTAGQILIEADGPVTGDLAAIVDRTASDTYLDGNPGRSYYFDLLPGKSLTCKLLYFKQRSDYGSGASDYFQLQGTNTEGITNDWTPLCDVENVPAGHDATLTAVVPNGNRPNAAYRRFRIISAGPWFTIGELELYGDLHIDADPTSNSVTRINVTSGGIGYGIAPAVVIVGDGTGATGRAIVVDGVVTRVDVTNPGLGYSTATCQFIVPGGGEGASATAIIDGTVTDVDLDDGGVNFDAVPDVVFGAGGGGSGAAATAVLGFGLNAINVTDHGDGNYPSPPAVNITPANATASSQLSYKLNSITLDSNGGGYGSTPDVIIDAPTGADGIQATAHAVMGTGASPVTENLEYVSDGDNNGVFHRMGTNFGVGGWVNPYTAGRLGITSVDNGAGDHKASIVDQVTSDYSADSAAPHIVFDLGSSRSLVIDGYSYRYRSGFNTFCPVAWTVEGSNDGSDWTHVVDTVTGEAPTPDPTFDSGDPSTHKWVSRAIAGEVTAYRYWRFSMTGNNNSGTTHLSIGEFELYGAFSYLPVGAVPTDEVASIVIDDVGFGYLNTPGVSFSGSGGAVATANLETNGYVDSVVVTATDKFETTPAISFGTPGTGATAVGVIDTSGVIIRIDLTAGGNNYQVPPLITFDTHGGPGSGAAATSSIVGPVTGFAVTDGGDGYGDPPEVHISSSSGSGATGIAVLTAGVVTSITLVTPGSDYETAPTVGLTAVGGPEAVAILGFPVEDITLTNRGGGFEAPPAVHFNGDGNSAVAQCFLGFGIDHVEIIQGGDGYGPATPVFYGDGTGAAGTAVRGFKVASTSITNGGANYLTEPVVAVSGGGAYGADGSFRAKIGRQLRTIYPVTRGTGYTSDPTVGIGGDGSGAAAHVVRSFVIASYAVTAQGSGYLVATVEVGAPTGQLGRQATAHAVIRAYQTLTSNNTNVVDGDQVVIGGKTYTFKTVLTPTEGEVLIGADADASLLNLINAINHTGVSGTDYSCAVANADVSAAVAVTAHAFKVSSRVTGPASVSIVTTTTSANLTWGGATLTGGIDSIVIDDEGFGYLSAPAVTVNGDGTEATATAAIPTGGAIDSIVIDTVGSNFSTPPPITLTGGAGTGATAAATLNTSIAGPIVKIEIVGAGRGYTTAPILTIVPGTSGGSGATATTTLATLGSIVAVTMTAAGVGYTATAGCLFFNMAGGTGAVAVGILKPTGRIEGIQLVSGGENFTTPPIIELSGGGGSGGTVTATLSVHGKIKELDLIFPGPPYSVAPLVSFIGGGGTGAAALYLLGKGFPTLIEDETDPTEGIRIIITKDIIDPSSPRIAGFIDRFPIDTWHTLQIASKVDLSTLPPPDFFTTSQHVGFPHKLLAVTPIWDQASSFSSSNNPVRAVGSSAVTLSVHGSILVLKTGGFQGAALARVERQFFFGPPPDDAVPQPTIIRPSSGTAIIRGGSNSAGASGSTAPTLFFNMWGQPIHIGDLWGYGTDGTPIYLQPYGGAAANGGSSGSISTNTQIVDINDVMTPGLNIGSDFNAVADNEAVTTGSGGAEGTTEQQLHVEARAKGTFSCIIPGSCPVDITPGMIILAQVVVEKWRFGLYVRNLVRVIAPGYCDVPGPST